MVRKDRNREGGGVAIFYRSHLNVKVRDELVPDSLELLCLEIIKSGCKPLLIASIYRPPNTTVDTFDKIHDFIRNLDCEHKDFVMVGDLNCDFLAKNKTSNTNRSNDMLELFQIKQVITEPRITENTETYRFIYD